MDSMKNTFRNLGALVLSLAAATGIGCSQEDSTPKIPLEKNSEMPTNNTSRYKVKMVATFEDDIAYGNKRGIYEITDTQTGKVYLGVSGIGITETGSHSQDKSTVEDER